MTRIRRRNPFQQRADTGAPGGHLAQYTLATIQPQLGLPGPLVGTMTLKAVVSQQRTNLAIKIHGPDRLPATRRPRAQTDHSGHRDQNPAREHR